jgi:hypothetical protein
MGRIHDDVAPLQAAPKSELKGSYWAVLEQFFARYVAHVAYG